MSIRNYLRLDDVDYWTAVIMAITGSVLYPPKETPSEEDTAPVLTLVQEKKRTQEPPPETANAS